MIGYSAKGFSFLCYSSKLLYGDFSLLILVTLTIVVLLSLLCLPLWIMHTPIYTQIWGPSYLSLPLIYLNSCGTLNPRFSSFPADSHFSPGLGYGEARPNLSFSPLDVQNLGIEFNAPMPSSCFATLSSLFPNIFGSAQSLQSFILKV